MTIDEFKETIWNDLEFGYNGNGIIFALLTINIAVAKRIRTI